LTRDPGWKILDQRSGIRDKHPGSATLLFSQETIGKGYQKAACKAIFMREINQNLQNAVYVFQLQISLYVLGTWYGDSAKNSPNECMRKTSLNYRMREPVRTYVSFRLLIAGFMV
jgi:hypothetical protein